MQKRNLPFGLEIAQVLATLARATQLLSGMITLGFISHFFDLKNQGYYYTFNSLIAMQVFAEVGLGMVLIQYTAHEMAKLNWGSDGTVRGEVTAEARLRALVIFALRWFGISGLLLVAILIPVGKRFFDQSADLSMQPANLLASWNMLVIFVGLNLIISALFSIIEGAGKIAEVAIVRLIQFTLSGIVTWFAIVFGAGLFALGLQYFVMTIIGMVYLILWRGSFFRNLMRKTAVQSHFKWLSEVFPFQWRIALSWLSGYFVNQYTIPLIFSTHGPEAAGRIGMSMQIFSAVSSVAIIFVSARVPTFARLIAEKKEDEVDIIFKRSAIQSSVLLGISITLIILIVGLIHHYNIFLSSRLLTFNQSLMLAFACIGGHAIYAQSIYIRCHKVDPFVTLSVINAFSFILLSFFIVPKEGVGGAVAVYTFVTLCISLPIGSWIYFKFRRGFLKLSN